MRLTILTLLLCVPGVLAVKFARNTVDVPLDPGSLNNINLVYYVYKPDGFQAGGPIFYCTTGREGARSAKQKFSLFDSISSDYKDAAVVFVDQRFYGESTKKIKTLADLAPLTISNVVNDHAFLITHLAGTDQLNSKNFLIFGGGYGGLIAGYVVNYFATTPGLKDTYKVLGWSSSTPIRQIRQGTELLNKLNDMLAQFNVIFSQEDNPDCTSDNLSKLTTFFANIKALTSANQAIIDKMYLKPKPIVVGITPAEATDNLKELAVYVRKQVLQLLPFDNFPYDNFKPINGFCKSLANVKPLSTTTTEKEFNDVFEQFYADKDYPLFWKLSNDGAGEGNINSDLVVSAYQDCTEQQIAFCSTGNLGDVFVKSRWNNEECADSTNPATFDTMIEGECKGLFRKFSDLAAFGDFNAKRIDVQKFPFNLTHVVTTMNSKSILSTGIRDVTKFKHNANEYTHFWRLKSTDNWEFQSPRTCDSAKMRDVRYLVLRAFGCLSGLAKSEVCTGDVFDDGKADASDPDTLQSNCDLDDTVHFPFDGAPLFDPKPTQSTVPPDPNHSSTTTLPNQESTTTTSTTTTFASTTILDDSNGSDKLVPLAIAIFAITTSIWIVAR